MKAFVYHENPAGKASFTQSGDAWAVDDKKQIFAVADSPLRSLTKEMREYPFNDYGYEAASTFCTSFLEFGRQFIDSDDTSVEGFRKVFLKCNRQIKTLNSKLSKKYNDPLNYDLAETVGIGALIKNGILYYGGLEDCYLNLLRGGALDEISTQDYQIMKAAKYMYRLSEKNQLKKYLPNGLKNKVSEEILRESFWCNHLRNNPSATDEDGQPVGWGCFTGEEKTSHFIQSHSVRLKEGDHILLFSDGMIPILSDDNFLKWFIKNVKNEFYFQLEMREKILELLKGEESMNKEKTLVYFKY